ncbi:unnamed protein product [Schistosoma mattheei]|uniref:Uncharacterized protein n=1 Tax=Schistosoma mattheei TaxID=31246 RepID=A0A183P0B6_9TREM|nr:unnamed protein product [Schistosoma mattheei]
MKVEDVNQFKEVGTKIEAKNLSCIQKLLLTILTAAPFPRFRSKDITRSVSEPSSLQYL